MKKNLIETCADPVEIARKVKLAFKKMSGEESLACFAKVMTAQLPHPIKVAVWDAVRYSHIWWAVEEVLEGPIMENPVVQQAFADAVAMRRWMIANNRSDAHILSMATRPVHKEDYPTCHGTWWTNAQLLVGSIVNFEDVIAAEIIGDRGGILNERNFDFGVADFIDSRGNSLLWYLTYRDDQNAHGGFACPEIERVLLELGADPDRKNNLGLSWNDVRRHFIRTEI